MLPDSFYDFGLFREQQLGPVLSGGHRSGPVDETLLAGLVFLAKNHILLLAPPPVELAVPITHSGVIPISFNQDRRKSEHDARKGDRDPPERFPQGEVTLDITEGKLFLLFDLRERPSANQEIVQPFGLFPKRSAVTKI
jgi:hypothetical protein